MQNILLKTQNLYMTIVHTKSALTKIKKKKTSKTPWVKESKVSYSKNFKNSSFLWKKKKKKTIKESSFIYYLTSSDYTGTGK